MLFYIDEQLHDMLGVLCFVTAINRLFYTKKIKRGFDNIICCFIIVITYKLCLQSNTTFEMALHVKR